MRIPKNFKKIVVSKDSEEHLVYGSVYSPDEEDTQGDAMDAATIRKMAHRFLKDGLVENIDAQHNYKQTGSVVVESFMTRENDPDFAKDSWVLGVAVDDDSWELVKSGELNGFSMAGTALEKDIRKVLVEVLEAVSGTTEKSTVDILPEHDHSFFIKFDDDGKPEYGETDTQFGHSHDIYYTDGTEIALDHGHKLILDAEEGSE